jgi:hypothetical protein
VTYQEVQRRPAPYDVIAVAAGFVLGNRHLESVLLTIVAVLDDGSVDATETTGGERIHLCRSEFRLVSPPRGAWS